MREVAPVHNDEETMLAVEQAIDVIDGALAQERDLISRVMLGHEALHEVTKQETATHQALAENDVDFFIGFMNKVVPMSWPSYKQAGFNANKWKLTGAHFRPNSYGEANTLQTLSIMTKLPLVMGGHSLGKKSLRDPEDYRSTSYRKDYKGKVNLKTPVFVLGARALATSRVELILGTPQRVDRRSAEGYTEGEWTYKPGLFAGSIQTEEFKLLETSFKKRASRYVNKVESASELPKELMAAVDGGVWPNDFSDPSKLKAGRMGKAIRLKGLRIITAAMIASGDLRLEQFDYPNRMLDLAIAFDRARILKDVIGTHREKRAEILE